jgi:hypothetical protein
MVMEEILVAQGRVQPNPKIGSNCQPTGPLIINEVTGLPYTTQLRRALIGEGLL